MRAAIGAGVASLALLASFAVSAQAAIVTVGPNLSEVAVSPTEFEDADTVTNVRFNPAGALLTSPVSGVVVRWNVAGGTGPGTYRLRAITPHGAGSYLFSDSTETVASVPSPGIQTFAAAMPIAAGQAIALDVGAGTFLGRGGFGESEGWNGFPADGAIVETDWGGEDPFGFNAEVLPPPSIGSLGTTSGSTVGGTSVTITGENLAKIKGVSFGSTAATYTVYSEEQITATAPAAAAGSVPVTVTTVAGTATAAQQFTYTAPPQTPITTPAPTCKVGKLKGKKLKAAKKAITAAACKTGKVTKKKGVTTKTGKVVKQSPKPGTTKSAGSKVNLTLG